MKRCSKCKHLRELSNFAKDRTTADGHCTWCRKCKSQRDRSLIGKVIDRQPTRMAVRKTYDKSERRREQKRVYSAQPRVREHIREYHLKYYFGLTTADYNRILLSQGSRCAICLTDTPGGKGRFHVDHSHKTGAIRGLLCHHCNTGLGKFGDDLDVLLNAALYLERTGVVKEAA